MKNSNSKKSNSRKDNQETNNFLLIVGIIMIVLVIYLLFTTCNNKKSNQDNNDNNNNNNNNVTAENFSNGLEPAKLHRPRNFELYKINNLENKIEFTFYPPKPNIIANQVTSYFLVIIGYTQSEKDDQKVNTIVSKQVIFKNVEDLNPNENILIKEGKLKLSTAMPPKVINKEDGPERIYYKFGLACNYPNIFSLITNVSNIPPYYPLDEEYDYYENKQLLELGREFKDRLEQVDETQRIVEDPNIDFDFKYNQIADMLGDYPNNLNIGTDHLDLKEMIKKGFQNQINAKIE